MSMVGKSMLALMEKSGERIRGNNNRCRLLTHCVSACLRGMVVVDRVN